MHTHILFVHIVKCIKFHLQKQLKLLVIPELTFRDPSNKKEKERKERIVLMQMHAHI